MGGSGGGGGGENVLDKRRFPSIGYGQTGHREWSPFSEVDLAWGRCTL